MKKEEPKIPIVSRFDVSQAQREMILIYQKDYPFPAFIRALRNAACVSRWQMAKEIGISHVRIFLWEHGEFMRPIQEQYIERLADYLGVSRDLLYAKMIDFSAEATKKHLKLKLAGMKYR